MALVIPLLLFVLALVDASFCGFRSAAGRSLLITKLDFFRRALGRGAVVGVAALALIGGVIGATLSSAADPRALYDAYVEAGRFMLYWYAPYAAIVLLALSFYGSARPEWRALATTIVLGPLTCLRPFVIVGGAIHALVTFPPLPVAASIVVACATMPALGRVQNRLYRDQSPFEA